jgi:TolA-binding protein
VGTRFDLTWDGAKQALDIVLIDGSVEVEAPWLAPQRVVAGQSLRLVVPRSANDSAEDSAQDSAADAPVIVPKPDTTTSVEGASSGAKPPVRSPDAPESLAGWRSLAVAGDYREAFARAQAAGFDGEVARANASDLLLLGDTSRYAGKTAQARQCYQALRQRFASSPEGSRALFRLGVLDFPSPSAVVSFETFLRERPGDPLAPEALGRILEIHHRSGNTAQAQTVARRYLANYPKGAHAKLAKGVIGE